jgi:ABC-type tungstate transport system permease subunit
VRLHHQHPKFRTVRLSVAPFEKKTGIKVDVVAVGTGAAIEIGKRGDADVVMVHAKEQELKAVEEGWFKDRHDLMYNDFVIIGPTQRPPEDQRHEVHRGGLQKDRGPG